MIRVRDPAIVNAVAGQAGIDADFTELLSEPQHVCLIDKGSGALFAWRGPGIFEVHVFFRVRGREALTLGHAMLEMMRRDYGGRLFWSLIPPGSRHVLMFTRLMGWTHRGPVETRHGPQHLFDTGECPCQHP